MSTAMVRVQEIRDEFQLCPGFPLPDPERLEESLPTFCPFRSHGFLDGSGWILLPRISCIRARGGRIQRKGRVFLGCSSSSESLLHRGEGSLGFLKPWETHDYEMMIDNKTKSNKKPKSRQDDGRWKDGWMDG